MDCNNRFAFGRNWANFLSLLDEARIVAAEKSLQTMLGVDNLHNKRFLDIGSGSGLFSLAARRLGARVHSFDYDPESVACTEELRLRYYPNDMNWSVEQGSVLDRDYLEGLGIFDIVYSWGVLHHTGAMWLSIGNALQRVAEGGRLFIAIYNDQGAWSRVWWLIKYGYNKLPPWLRRGYAYSVWYSIITLNIIKYTVKLQPMTAIRPLLDYKPGRGMSHRHDIVDWMGGFPFEFATYEVLQAYLAARGFALVNGVRSNGIGCHQMVFAKDGKDA